VQAENGMYGGAIGGSGLEAKLFRFSPPTHFGVEYLPLLLSAGNVRVVIHGNASTVALEPGGTTVAHIECLTLNRKSLTVKAQLFVLAAGGLETPRLLLNSRGIQAAGIGNVNDLLGRFFMEHVACFSATATYIPADFPRAFLRLTYETRQRNLNPTPAVGLPESLMRNAQLLNGAAFFVWRPIHKVDDEFYSRQMRGPIDVIDTLKHRRPPSRQVLESLRQTLVHYRTVVRLFGKAAYGRLRLKGLYALNIQGETVPNRESRVVLAESRDALGVSQLSVRWQLSDQDLQSFRGFEEYLLKGLEKGGLRIRKARQDLEPDGWPVQMTPSSHHMGTTRMSVNPRTGVVDENCRVHGVNNLFIASSSVFPTAGMANPTLTVVALAVRLADHIRRVLA